MTKNKNEVGFPKKSILECMRINKLDFKYIDYVVYSSLYMHSKEKLKQIVNNYSANYLDQIKEKKLNERPLFDYGSGRLKGRTEEEPPHDWRVVAGGLEGRGRQASYYARR